jgi:hypothetical protein
VFRTNVVENSETHVLLPQAIAENRGVREITYRGVNEAERFRYAYVSQLHIVAGYPYFRFIYFIMKRRSSLCYLSYL